MANKRIVLSALYLGNGELEKHLVKALEEKFKRSHNIFLKVLFDYHRASRHGGTIGADAPRGIDLLQDFLKESAHNSNIEIGLFKTNTNSGFQTVFNSQIMEVLSVILFFLKTLILLI